MRIRLALLYLTPCILAVLASPRSFAAGPASARPTIVITSPGNGAAIHGSTVTVQVSVSNFKLVPPVYLNPPALPGNQGHIHYILDSISNFTATRDAVTLLSHSWTGVAPGPHTITAYLATSQHVQFPGTRAAVVHVNVVPGRAASPPRPSISIMKLAESVSGRDITLTVSTAVSNFKLVPPVYKNPPLLPGNQGHIHYVLDNVSNFQTTRDAVASLTHPWTNVSPGRHTIYAYLANSQHQRFPNTQVAQVTVNVPALAGSSAPTTLRIGAEPKTGGGADRWRPGPDLPAVLAGLLLLLLGMAVRRSVRRPV